MPLENYVLLQEVTLSSTASSVLIDNLPTTGYTDLKIVISARCNTASIQQVLAMLINSSSSGYTDKYIYGSGTSSGSGVFTTSSSFIGDTPSGNATANTFSNHEIYIPNYRSSIAKSWSIESVAETDGNTAFIEMTAGSNSTTSPITSLEFIPTSGGLVPGSSFTVYGIAALGVTPTISPKAFGGDIIKTDGTFWYHAFTSSGLFVPQTNLTCNLLVVAGGAGGGRTVGGGGGAGGLLGFTGQSLSAQNYSVIVGSGGAGATAFGSYSANGSNSQFGSLTTAVGGGGSMGAANGTNPGLPGGSGGGAPGGGDTNNTGGAASPAGQGNIGGNGLGGSQGGGGGGGAGGAGGNAVANTKAGNGGVGSSTFSSWGLVTSTGQNSSGTVYYAGGGGGGSNSGAGGILAGDGGLGGGAAGRAQASAGVPTAATPNTGGGGGGSGGNGDASNGGNGGSGIIIIRYPV
jgi:hypothetical protein